MEDEIKFPLDFKQCPNCGSDRRIADEVMKMEKEKGRAKPELIAWMFQHQNIIADPSRALLSAPVITTFYDVCADCGTVYCIHTELKTGMLTGPQGKQPPMKFSPS